MSLSIQTNVDSINAQENLRVNGEFSSRTIQRLTSGYRINSSSDDAAGLAVANKFRTDIAELNQGVRNANDGISALGIVDGGLSNISNMIDRLKTLATQSASQTFSGDRATLNTEYQTLLGEIDRQAQNIGLGTGTTGGRYGQNIDVYIGGGAGIQGNAKITVNMAGSQVDSAGLGIDTSNILAGAGTGPTGNSIVIKAGSFLVGGTQDFTFRTSNTANPITVTVDGGTGGITGRQAVDQLNSKLAGSGITAQIDSNGKLAFFGNKTAYSLDVAAATGGGDIATAGTDTENSNMYTSAAGGAVTAAGVLTITVGSKAIAVNLGATDTQTQVADKINTALNPYGVFAVLNAAGAGGACVLEGTQKFTVTDTGSTGFGATAVTAPTAAPGSNDVSNALAALDKLTAAVTSLGTVQGKIGAGQNQLQYAVDLAQSQISSFSAAQSRIRDADVAAEAANLTKSQVLEQASIAALAQANQQPQQLLSLLKG